MLLYGCSLVYGFTGTTCFDALAAALRRPAQAGSAIGALIGLVFLVAGLAFKVAAVPFHMWTPDVYEGAPTPVTAFIAAAPKVAAIGLLVRVLCEPFGHWSASGSRSSSSSRSPRWCSAPSPPSARPTSSA